MKQYIEKLDTLGQTYLVKKAPFQIPDKFREMLVKYGPWVSLVVVVLSVPSLLSTFRLTNVFAPLGYMGQAFGYYYYVNMLVALITLILTALALPGLFRRQLSGWRFAWYSSLVSALGSLITLQLLGLIIGLAVSMYVLYQIKPLYK